MANEKEPEPGTRGFRVNEIRLELELSRADLARALADVAKVWGITEGGEWTPTRVSRLILSRQPMSLDDAAVVVKLAEAHGLKGKTWDWFVFGDVSKAANRDRFKKIAGQ
jgi:hypothetical protein